MRYLFSILLLSQITSAQEIKSPGVLVLTPMDFILDESIEPGSKKFEVNMTDEQVAECISERNKNEDREIVMKMNEVECEIARHSNISTTFTYYLYGWLTFKLYGTFDDAIIYPAKGPEKRDLAVYNALSEKHDVNWIVDLKKVEFNSGPEGLKGTARVELWNKNTNEITLSTEIEIDDQNYGGEMSCEDGTLNCLFINGVVYISHDILKSMYSKEKYWR